MDSKSKQSSTKDIAPENASSAKKSSGNPAHAGHKKSFLKKLFATKPRKTKIIDDKFIEQLQDDLSSPDEEKKDIDPTFEKLNAEIEALNEVRKVTNERFLRFAEEVGQLRGDIVNREKDIKDISLQVTKSIDIVSKVQPEKLYVASQNQNVKIAKLEATIESNKSFIGEIMKQMKNMQSKLNLFRGVEQVMQLNKESLVSLTDVQKLSMLTKGKADKTEKFFIKIGKQYKDFERFEEDRGDMQQLHLDITTKMNDVNVKISELTPHEDFIGLEHEAHEMNELNLKTVNRLKLDVAKLHESLNLFDKRLSFVDNASSKTSSNIESLKHQNKLFKSMLKSGKAELVRNNKALKKFYSGYNLVSSMQKQIKVMQKIFNNVNPLPRLVKDMQKQIKNLEKSSSARKK